MTTQEAIYRYRLINEHHGSSVYGNCEICGKSVDTVYHQIEEQKYQFGWTLTGKDYFGHKDCLLETRRDQL